MMYLKKLMKNIKNYLTNANQGNIKYIKEELGDLLFSIVNLARFLRIDSEGGIKPYKSKIHK